MEKGTAWWAIIAEPVDEQSLQIQSSEAGSGINPSCSVQAQPETEKQLHLRDGLYLDRQKRYQLQLEDGTDGNSTKLIHASSSRHWFQARVVDSRPLQKPMLEEQLDELEELLVQSPDQEAWSGFELPQVAYHYLNLQALVPTLPEVRDAWQEGDREVVLLADRSQYQLLSSLWAQEPLPVVQVLHYLDEIAQLWQVLSEANCCQSLLEETNLRVDEDQTLVLQQLYPDPPNAQPSLVSLAQMWQALLEQADRSEYDFLKPLLEQVASGEVKTVERLRAELQFLARHQQVIPSEPSNLEVTLEAATDNREGEDLPTVVLPMELHRLEDFGATDIGRQRTQNEDNFSIDTQIRKQENNQGQQIFARGLYIVCDGMGGHASGEVASATAVETLQRYFQEHWLDELPDEETIAQGILLANEAIYSVNKQNACVGSDRMGTTLVMALVQNNQVAIAHVGDSRIYRLTRKRGLEQLSLDHAVGQQEILRGVEPEIAYSRSDAYHLTQALGPCESKAVKPSIQFLSIHEDTLLLLCSDGLSDNNFLEGCDHNFLVSLISSRADLERGLIDLIEQANQHNGHDNITSIAIRIKVKPKLGQKSLI